MADDLTIHVIRKSDLRLENPYASWSDPGSLAPLSPGKRAGLLCNPLSDSDEDAVQLIGVAGNRVIGRIDLLAGEIAVEGQPVRTFWASNLFVDPDFRSSGMGLMLMLRIQAVNHTVSVCGISQAVRPIYEKLRWPDFPMPRYVLLRRSRPVVERYLGASLASRVASKVLDLALLLPRAATAAASLMRSRGLRVRPLEKMPRELDPLLVRNAPPVAPHRSSAWINWLLANQFDDNPTRRRELCLIEDAAGTPVAYFLIKSRFFPVATQREFRNLTLASLQDWIIFEPERLGTLDLVLVALRRLARLSPDAIEVCMPEPLVGPRLCRFGFLRAGQLDLLFKASGKSPLLKKEFRDPSRWRIRPADGDNFFT